AIVKYLQDRGVLVLLTSSALAREDGWDPKEPLSLLALFLFSSPRAPRPPAEKQDPKEGREGRDRSDISLKIASVLPGIRYALRKAAASSRSDAGSARIEQHLREYAKLRENSRPTPGQTGDLAGASLRDEGAHPSQNSQKLPERSLSQLRRYLRDPGGYALGISAALECLSGNSSSGATYKSKAPDPAPEWDGEGSQKDGICASSPWGQQNRRKSSRILVARRNLPALDSQANPVEEESRSRESARKKGDAAFSFPKKTGSAGNSSEPMLKLANLQFPHGRKRGAEVLAAEIVHKSQPEAAEKETSAPAGPALEAKRPKTLENPEVKKVPVAEGGTKPGKSKILKSLENRAWKAPENSRAESERKELLPGQALSQSQAVEIPRNELYPVGIPGVGFGANCESHALNLLADLALGSCLPPFIPSDSGLVPASRSPSRDSREQPSPSKPRSPRVASDHRYHRADKQGRKPTWSGKASQSQALPEKPHPSRSASPPGEKTPGTPGENGADPSPAPLRASPPREAPEAAPELNRHSLISAEHSYASPMPEHPRKHPNPRGNPNPGPAPPKNGAGSAPAALPLVGKVLPFRHQQQSGSAEPARGGSAAGRKEDFAKSRAVSVCGSSVKVTCRWEEEYRFHLDSRYTNDSLEKTVIRALHGPWDPDLPDDLEGMKLILHMWVALFYRKPSKLLSSSRKVVEHSNPRKFVSINSSGGFLELSDDSQDCFGLETCPADSGSDPDQTPSSSLDPSAPSQGASQPERSPADSQTDADGAAGAVDSTVSSSSGELPRGEEEEEEEEEEEPSSTSCPESLSRPDGAGEKLDGGAREPEAAPEEGTAVSLGLPGNPAPPRSWRSGIFREERGSRACGTPTGAGTLSEGEEPQLRARDQGSPSVPEQDSGSRRAVAVWGKSVLLLFPARSQLLPFPSPGMILWVLSFQEEPVEEELLDATTTPSPSQELPRKSPNPSAVQTANPCSQAPNSSPAPWPDPPCEPQGSGEQRENRWESGPGSGPGPPEGGEGTGDAGRSPEAEDGAADPRPGRDSVPWEASPGRTEPAGAGGEREECREPSEQSEKEEGREGNGDFEDENSFLSPNRDELPEPWDAPATPDSETDGVGVASPGSPHSDSGELLFPPDPSPVRGAQPDSATGSAGSAGAALSNGPERKNGDHTAPAERWEPAGSSLESPRGQGLGLALSPDSSSVCLTSPDGSVDPWAAPEDQPVESIQSPSQSDLGRSSRFPRARGDDAGAERNSLDAEERSQGGSGDLEEEQDGEASANGTEELEDPVGAGDGQDSPFDCRDLGDDPRAEDRDEQFPRAENSLENDAVSAEAAADAPQEIPVRPHLLEPEPSSSVRERIPAIQELPRQQQRFPEIPGDSAPAFPAHAGDSDPSHPAVPSRRESVLCRLWKPCQEGGAAQVSVAAWSLDGSVNPSCSQELIPAPAPCSPGDELVPEEPGSAPPSPCDPWEDPEGAEAGSPIPGILPATPDSARWSGSCASAWSQEPVPPEDVEGGSGVPSPAPFPEGECEPCDAEGSEAFPDPGSEEGEGEIPASPVPRASPAHRDLSGESLELSDAEDFSDGLPREEQLPSPDRHEGSAFEDPLENSFGDSEQEYLEGNSQSPLPARNPCVARCTDAAGARTTWDSSSGSSVPTEEQGEDWDRGIPRDYGSFVVTRQCRERTENSQPPRRRSRRCRESPLFRSLLGTWRGLEEITQNTLDMECLRFHYKLKQILRHGKATFSTSRSIFPKDLSPRAASPIPLSPRSRSPLQVTLSPSDSWPGGLRSQRHRDAQRGRSRDPRAPFHLGKLRYDRSPPEPRGGVAVILDEFSEFQRAVLSRAGSEGPARGEEAGNARTAPAQPGGTVAFQGMIRELCGALRSHLRRVAEGRPGMFYLLETGKEPFFDRLKALLRDEGFVRVEPRSFCGAKHRESERLLVVVRNEDISSHIHRVPCLLELKRCPGVVFAGVDDAEDVTGDTFQELFQAGGFVVSDQELLERVTLGQLKELVKVLEKLNRNGSWKWLLHHGESRKLRGDLRDDAQKKQLLLKWCRGEDLVELLHFHGCDSTAAPESRRIQCLLELQVQHISARFAVYLTENPSSSSREILESQGILVADVDTFLGTAQKVAAPFRRSYW
ncbi:F208B protein, partial [Dasyornis broadbenti]|nr:F208B protein [Dasyornis broadbenti]